MQSTRSISDVPQRTLTEGQLRDENEQERMQIELLHAQKMEALGQVISGVAHEINNPLSAIIAFSQLLRSDERLPPDMVHDADLLVQEANRTRRIVQNLLDFARQRTPDRQPNALAPILERTLELNAYALRAGRIEVRLLLPSDLPPVLIDADQIQQVMLNLTLNAIQAIRGSKPSGTITFTARSESAGDTDTGPRVRLSVEDDGPGVEKTIRPRLFEPFFTTKDVGQGTGLGLSVSYGIVAGHGGNLWFEPAAGGGAVFLLELPAVGPAAVRAARSRHRLMTTPDKPYVRLRPLTAEEFPAFLVASEAGYAEDIEMSGGQTHEAAQQKAKADFAAILPQGLETPGHTIYVVEADGVAVGRLWLAERASGGRQTLFIYDISIDPEWQGRGYGRAAMRLAEEQARARGIGFIELNVFGGNDVARNLYRSLGYVETSVQMRKAVASED